MTCCWYFVKFFPSSVLLSSPFLHLSYGGSFGSNAWRLSDTSGFMRACKQGKISKHDEIAFLATFGKEYFVCLPTGLTILMWQSFKPVRSKSPKPTFGRKAKGTFELLFLFFQCPDCQDLERTTWKAQKVNKSWKHTCASIHFLPLTWPQVAGGQQSNF